MGKQWDTLPPGLPWAKECLRILKPGSYLLAFGGTRTWHRLAVAVEDAGFEIRDSIAWLYGQGFPKSKQHLKPAFEPIVVGRKFGGGSSLNIDGCRLEQDRWPANVTLDESQETILNVQSGVLTTGGGKRNSPKAAGIFGAFAGDEPDRVFEGSSGGASRFFYVAKASNIERPKVQGVVHPTVKPLALMRWLCRLVTPVNGTILDPFTGSGTTVEAALLEGFGCVAIEREAEYLPLIQERLKRSLI